MIIKGAVIHSLWSLKLSLIVTPRWTYSPSSRAQFDLDSQSTSTWHGRYVVCSMKHEVKNHQECPPLKPVSALSVSRSLIVLSVCYCPLTPPLSASLRCILSAWDFNWAVSRNNTPHPDPPQRQVQSKHFLLELFKLTFCYKCWLSKESVRWLTSSSLVAFLMAAKLGN